MKIKINRFEIALCRWTLPFSYIGFKPRPKEYGFEVMISNLFQFWIAIDFNKYDKNGFLIFPNNAIKSPLSDSGV